MNTKTLQTWGVRIVIVGISTQLGVQLSFAAKHTIEPRIIEQEVSSSSTSSIYIISGTKPKGPRFAEADRDRLMASATMCGNGLLEAGEECDDGNHRDNDGCSTACLLEVGICGDGIVQILLDEQCETSLHDASLSYDCVDCRYVSPTCGDGTLDDGEECDQGKKNSSAKDATCRPDCSLGRCGDGIVDMQEECDDGNKRNNDGCSRYCNVEDSMPAAAVPPQNPPTPLPPVLPLAQLQPLIATHAPVGKTGPAAVAVIGTGTAAGWSWVKRRKR